MVIVLAWSLSRYHLGYVELTRALARPIIKTDKRPAITSDFIGVLLARSLSQAATANAPTRRDERRAGLDILPLMHAAASPSLPHRLRLQIPKPLISPGLRNSSRPSTLGPAPAKVPPPRKATGSAY